MFCPTCNSQNLATSVRCNQCGTTLIYEAEGHSNAYKAGVMALDRRMYGGIGAFVGFCLSALLLNTVLESLFLNERLVYVSGVVVGGICGRVTAWLKWRHS
jgi:hypothetical protein